MEKLKTFLSKYGDIQVIKKGYVFTLYMTGEKLSKWDVVNEIQTEVLKFCGDTFPLIECMRNDNNYLLLILRPEK